MTPHTPTAAVRDFVAAMNRGDLDAALACYAPGAIFVPEPGRPLRDPAALREALAGMLALKPTLATHRETVLESGDTALYQSAWSMTGRDPTGAEVRMEGHSADVLRRGADGRWMIAVDNPWGAMSLDAND